LTSSILTSPDPSAGAAASVGAAVEGADEESPALTSPAFEGGSCGGSDDGADIVCRCLWDECIGCGIVLVVSIATCQRCICYTCYLIPGGG
jgi:hypothetical protein